MPFDANLLVVLTFTLKNPKSTQPINSNSNFLKQTTKKRKPWPETSSLLDGALPANLQSA